MQKVLFLTYNIAPRLGAQSIQVSRQISHYPDPFLLAYGDNSVIKNLKLDAYQVLASRTDSIQVRPIFSYNNIISRLALKLCPCVGMFPDPHLLWSTKAFIIIAARIATRTWQPKCIVAYGHPMSVLLVAVLLSKIFHIPLISSISDPWPWVRNAYYKTSNTMIYWINTFFESLVFSNSSVLITNNNKARLAYKGIYPDSNIAVLPHSFDSSLFLGNSLPPQANSVQKIIRIIGNFYGPRSLSLIYNALTSHANSTSIKTSVNCFKLEVYGNYDSRKLIRDLKHHQIEHLVELMGNVSYKESLSLMSSSDFLLVIDAEVEPNLFLPSKIADYIGSNRPIVAIAKHNSPTSQLLREYNHLVIDHSSVSLLFEAIDRHIFYHLIQNDLINSSRNPLSAACVSQSLKKLVINSSMLSSSINNSKLP